MLSRGDSAEQALAGISSQVFLVCALTQRPGVFNSGARISLIAVIILCLCFGV